MTVNVDHETIFKSLQDIRSMKPVIMVLTTPRRIHIIDTMVNAIGFRAIYPDISIDTIKVLKQSTHAVVIDIIAFLMQKDTKILDILGDNFISKYGVVHICDSVVLYHDSCYIKTLKNILKYHAPLCVVNHSLPIENIQSIIQKSNYKFWGFGQSKKISILNPLALDDIVYKHDNTISKIMGSDNINHLLNCHSILYAVLAAALMTVNSNKDICGFGSAIMLRAASRRAIAITNGPGSFTSIFIDSLFHLKRDYLYQIKCDGNVEKVG